MKEQCKVEEECTHFWPASISKYFRSSSVCSGVFMLTNVVAIPVFPLRPVRPICGCRWLARVHMKVVKVRRSGNRVREAGAVVRLLSTMARMLPVNDGLADSE